jgi:hypothetical protein
MVTVYNQKLVETSVNLTWSWFQLKFMGCKTSTNVGIEAVWKTGFQKEGLNS